MADVIDAYLASLGQRLSKRLTKSVVSEHVREIGAHLRESVADRVAHGQTGDLAAFDALRNLGCDRLIADGLIRANSGIAELSTWRLAWVPALIFIAYGIIPLTFLETPRPSDTLMSITLWLPTIFLIVFSFACFRSRRLLIKPMVLVAALIVVANVIETAAFSPLGVTAYSHSHRRSTIFAFDHQISGIETKIASAFKLDADGPYPPAFRDGNQFMSPSTYETVESGSGPIDPIEREIARHQTTLLLPGASEKVARENWRLNGAAYVRELQSEASEAETNRNYWLTARFDTPTFATLTGRLLQMALVLLAAIFAVNLLCLGVERAVRALIGLAWKFDRLAG